MKKYLSSVLILTIIWMSLHIPCVGVAFASDSKVLHYDNVHYEENFFDADINPRIVPNVTNSSGASSGTVAVNSGTLEIRKNSLNNDWCGIDLYLKADKTEFDTGECVLQYTLRRSGNETIQLRSRAGNTGHYSTLTWFDDNVHLKYNPGNGETSTTINSDVYKSDTELIVTTYHNFDKGTYTLWLNGTAVLEGVHPLYSTTILHLSEYTPSKRAQHFVLMIFCATLRHNPSTKIQFGSVLNWSVSGLSLC